MQNPPVCARNGAGINPENRKLILNKSKPSQRSEPDPLPAFLVSLFNPKTEIDLEQEHTESTERRLGPEKLWNPFVLCSLCALL
jgi:hypothetical protein